MEMMTEVDGKNLMGDQLYQEALIALLMLWMQGP
jgi:hypothetical protein